MIKYTLIWMVILSIIIIMILLIIYHYQKIENYWPYSTFDDGMYWQSQQTFNNNTRYMDQQPYLGIYRSLDLGKWPSTNNK